MSIPQTDKNLNKVIIECKPTSITRFFGKCNTMDRATYKNSLSRNVIRC